MTQLVPLIVTVVTAGLGALVALYATQDLYLYGRCYWVTIGGLTGVIVAGTPYFIRDAIALDRRIRVLGRTIRDQIEHVYAVENQARQAAEDNRLHLSWFVAEIEAWRIQVEEWLRRELPGSGADIQFETGTDQISLAPQCEHIRLGILRANLIDILDNLPSYVIRSR